MTSKEFLTWLLLSPPRRWRNGSTDLPVDAVPGTIIQQFKTASETLADLNRVPPTRPRLHHRKIGRGRCADQARRRARLTLAEREANELTSPSAQRIGEVDLVNDHRLTLIKAQRDQVQVTLRVETLVVC
jgi:hypothetical protein